MFRIIIVLTICGLLVLAFSTNGAAERLGPKKAVATKESLPDSVIRQTLIKGVRNGILSKGKRLPDSQKIIIESVNCIYEIDKKVRSYRVHANISFPLSPDGKKKLISQQFFLLRPIGNEEWKAEVEKGSKVRVGCED